MNIYFNLKKIHLILLTGLFIRLVVLTIVVLCDNEISIGFNGSNTVFDDVRYEAGAEIYSKTASSLIDIIAYKKAYLSVGDAIPDSEIGVFSKTPLWYWICSGCMYLFKNKISIRILNIIFSLLSIKYVYLFIKQFADEKTSLLSARLMAYLPYPILFSCFAYKDQFLTYLTFYIFYKASKYKNIKKASIREIIHLSINILFLFLLRSGLSLIIILIGLFIAISNKNENIFKTLQNKFRSNIILFVTICFICTILTYFNYEFIFMKASYYLIRYAYDGIAQSNINFLVINSPAQFWKIPIAFLISIIMPIGSYEKYHSWYGIVATLNYISIPIAVGNILYIFKRKFDINAYWLILLIFVFSVIFSINICRHYYSLLPICYIAFSDFLVHSKYSQKLLLTFISMTLFFPLIYHYFYR